MAEGNEFQQRATAEQQQQQSIFVAQTHENVKKILEKLDGLEKLPAVVAALKEEVKGLKAKKEK